jgi:hypothetical protein
MRLLNFVYVVAAWSYIWTKYWTSASGIYMKSWAWVDSYEELDNLTSEFVPYEALGYGYSFPIDVFLFL